jgi:hypothetical protein
MCILLYASAVTIFLIISLPATVLQWFVTSNQTFIACQLQYVDKIIRNVRAGESVQVLNL